MIDSIQHVWDYSLIQLSDGKSITVSQLALTLAVLILGIAIIRVIEKLVAKKLDSSSLQKDVAYALQRLFFYLLMIVLGFTVLGMLNVPLTAFAFISGAVAIGVGFGAQNIINNFISSWILMAEQPIRMGDLIELDQHYGTVEEIGNRSTRIRRFDGIHVLIPNSQLLERIVVNWTLVDPNIRTVVSVGVSYDSPVRKVEQLIYELVDSDIDVCSTPKPVVVFENFGDSALIFDCFFWCSSTAERGPRQIRSDLRFAITDAFRNASIEISFPQRDIHLNAAQPIDVRITKT